MNPLVTLVTGAVCQAIPAIEVAQAIRDGRWRSEVERLRSVREKAERFGQTPGEAQRVGDLKRALPLVYWCGTYSAPRGDALLETSGLLCVGLAIQRQKSDPVRARLQRDPHVFAAYTSSGGRGLKVIYRLPAGHRTHGGNFDLVAQRTRVVAGVVPGCDTRAHIISAVSYDPGAYLNAGAVPLPTEAEFQDEINGPPVAA